MINELNAKYSVLLAPASQTAAATRSATLDCLGADYAVIRVNYAAEVNTSAVGPAVVVTESEDTVASNFATWSSSFSRTEDLASAHGVIYCIDTRKRKRYLALKITAATHTTNDIVTAAAVGQIGRRDEVSPGTAGMIGSTNDAVIVG